MAKSTISPDVLKIIKKSVDEAVKKAAEAIIKAIGLKDGDECKSYEFINWITGKHEEFRKSIGLDKYTPYTKEQEKMFLKFISGSRCNP